MQLYISVTGEGLSKKLSMISKMFIIIGLEGIYYLLRFRDEKSIYIH